MFGIQWTFGTIGTLRLFQFVNAADYFILCILSICGGTALFGFIHFSGNLPFKGKRFIRGVQFSLNNATFSTTNHRKCILKKVKTLQLFGLRSDPIRLVKHNAIYLYFGAMINCIVTALVAFPALGK